MNSMEPLPHHCLVDSSLPAAPSAVTDIAATHISCLAEVEELQMLQTLRAAFPLLAVPGSALHVFNKCLLQIITNAKLIALGSLDTDAVLTNLLQGVAQWEEASLAVKMQYKAFLIACYVIILQHHPSAGIQQLIWSLPQLQEAYGGSTEEFLDISGPVVFKVASDEWNSLLQFRNALVLALQIVRERNKNQLEMAAGMVSGYCKGMSGGKPSKAVKRRHAIYHTETQSVVKHRNRFSKKPRATGEAQGQRAAEDPEVLSVEGLLMLSKQPDKAKGKVVEWDACTDSD